MPIASALAMEMAKLYPQQLWAGLLTEYGESVQRGPAVDPSNPIEASFPGYRRKLVEVVTRSEGDSLTFGPKVDISFPEIGVVRRPRARWLRWLPLRFYPPKRDFIVRAAAMWDAPKGGRIVWWRVVGELRPGDTLKLDSTRRPPEKLLEGLG